jgi:hypothetical protein
LRRRTRCVRGTRCHAEETKAQGGAQPSALECASPGPPARRRGFHDRQRRTRAVLAWLPAAHNVTHRCCPLCVRVCADCPSRHCGSRGSPTMDQVRMRARALRAVHCATSRGTLLLASGKNHLTGHVNTAARRAAGLSRSTTLSKPRPASGQVPAISVPSSGRAGWVRPRAPGRTQRQGLDRRGPVCERLSRSRPESAGDVP